MNGLSAFLEKYGELVLFAAVFAQQLGIPVAAIPVLIGAGALAAAGHMSLAAALAIAVAASIPGDLLWYYLGLRRGRRVLALLCRISIEPDSCVRRTELFFTKNGPASLVVSRFIPGLGTVATPLAGVLRYGLGRFLAYDVLGALVWAGVYIGLGYALGDQVERLTATVSQFGGVVAGAVIVALAGFLVLKLVQRRRILRSLNVERVAVDELKRMLDAGDAIEVVDLRSAAELADDPFVIPGAVRLDFAELEGWGNGVSRRRFIVLYCNCPNEVTSARAALLLRKNGLSRAQPLGGGLAAWRDMGHPVAPFVAVTDKIPSHEVAAPFLP